MWNLSIMPEHVTQSKWELSTQRHVQVLRSTVEYGSLYLMGGLGCFYMWQ
jgi:hypothetical protein